MKLYFVRHGETDANLAKRVVGTNDQLTATGHKQAEALTERFLSTPIDLILTSPQKRANETAQIIANKTCKKVQVTEFLNERKWPTEIEGKLLDGPGTEKVFKMLREKANNPAWHHNDEENFLDVKRRAQAFVEYLSQSAFENALAVSHEYFIKMVIAVMMHGDNLSYEIFRNIFHFVTVSNISLTLYEKEKDQWRITALSN